MGGIIAGRGLWGEEGLEKGSCPTRSVVMIVGLFGGCGVLGGGERRT